MMIRNIWVRAIWYSMALLMVVEATNSGSTDGCVMRGQCGSHGAPCVDPGSPELVRVRYCISRYFIHSSSLMMKRFVRR